MAIRESVLTILQRRTAPVSHNNNCSSKPDRLLEDAIEANTSGVLVRGGRGKLRIVGYEALVEAARGGKPLTKVPGEPVKKLAGASSGAGWIEDVASLGANVARALQAPGSKFGLLELGVSGLARLVSRHEGFAAAYESPSTGVRCQRPNKPAGVKPRDWFHYYPPNPRDQNRPNVCQFCGSPLP